MSYSDLLAQQDKELERLNQEYFADQATVRQLQNDHYDKAKYDGQLDRLKTLHEKKVKDVQTRFAQEQREYLGEPTPTEPAPDISQSQDKAADMIKAYRQQQTEGQSSGQQDTGGGEEIKRSKPAKGQPVDEAEVKKLAQQAREKREQKQQQQYRRGFRR
ncbi:MULTISPECIES: hypothetical protein [unclassified Spirosoma]|uniref:hypothetical protein n=1 Tax=unclassified Spirosoma TaxID=2621999 RepID=UPI000959AFC6|nr:MULTISPECIES: hypothetical protein [unclassified Spirosoma]MBN8824095.1 hypothetical protein [Spirosoma sp.]OJW70493.1 MAG: hypothetical protein BGO59_24925 [Spirosoma sp. 48-14]